ncbi:unnamed protein product [Schistosoma curassoni]|uniref:PHD-type domain-containing protein n=1 Tax=Schistosoma curassoni TaxID=6186 RepID=A0A183JJX8_9TREM|nr:unnamed protein product [Schistosoma curassoni]
MPRKKSLKLNNTGCIFCSEVDDYPLLGPIIEKNGFKFAASGLSQTNNENESPDDFIVGFAVSSILNELRRGRSLKCSVCRLPGACVGCVVNTCHTTFHLPCLIKAQGITIFEGNFPSYCRRHANRQSFYLLFNRCTSTWELPGSSSSEPEEQNPVQQHKTPKESVTLPSSMSHIPGWLTDYFLSLAPEKRLPVFEAWKHHTIHGLCCPLSWMHRNCIAGFAVSAALHYLKCPYCANREIFIRSIIDTGIWVPDQ